MRLPDHQEGVLIYRNLQQEQMKPDILRIRLPVVVPMPKAGMLYPNKKQKAKQEYELLSVDIGPLNSELSSATKAQLKNKNFSWLLVFINLYYNQK